MRLDYAVMAQWTPLVCAMAGTPPGRQLSCCWPHPPAWRPQLQLQGTWAQAQALCMHRQYPVGAHRRICSPMSSCVLHESHTEGFKAIWS